MTSHPRFSVLLFGILFSSQALASDTIEEHVAPSLAHQVAATMSGAAAAIKNDARFPQFIMLLDRTCSQDDLRIALDNTKSPRPHAELAKQISPRCMILLPHQAKSSPDTLADIIYLLDETKPNTDEYSEQIRRNCSDNDIALAMSHASVVLGLEETNMQGFISVACVDAVPFLQTQMAD